MGRILYRCLLLSSLEEIGEETGEYKAIGTEATRHEGTE